MRGVGASLVEVVGAEIGVDLAGGEQVPDDDQDGVAGRDGFGPAWGEISFRAKRSSASDRLRARLDAARIDKVALARRLGAEPPRGQSPFAISRGDQFEKCVKRDEFLVLFALLRPFGLDTTTVEALDWRGHATTARPSPFR